MSVAVLREVRLYGQLGKRFGQVHHLAIQTPHEAVRALCATVQGFQDFLLSEITLGYKVIVGKQAKTIAEIHEPSGPELIKIVPIVGGAKKGGLGMILLGVALYFGAPILGGLIKSTAIGGTIALYGAKLGVALMLGGVIGLLSPQRKASSSSSVQNDPSYAFDGPVNTTQQGLPVPLGYGRCMVGSAVISAGLSVDDTSPPPPAPPPAPPSSPFLPADQAWNVESYNDGR
jgi:predicted phage tail protein